MSLVANILESLGQALLPGSTVYLLPRTFDMPPHIHVFNTISPTIFSAEVIASMVTENETLFRQLGPGVPILLTPVPKGFGTTASVKFDDVGVHIGLDRGATPSCLAHEVMHLVLDIEGYPTYDGCPDAGLWASVLLDCEVDRRIESSGFPHDRDSHLTHMASVPLWCVPDADLLCHFVNFRAGPIRDSAELDAWLDQVRRDRPNVAKIGDLVLRRLQYGAAMRTAEGATVAMTAIARLLGEYGVADLAITYNGPVFEELRRDCWSESLHELFTLVRQGEELDVGNQPVP